MAVKPMLPELMRAHGVSRRGFLKYCASLTSALALPPALAPRIAYALEHAARPSVIWLSFQECTGCTEAITRSHAPTIEDLIFNAISLDYHHTLQAASGHAAEEAREKAMEENRGNYLVIVDGSIPLDLPGIPCIAGISNLDMLRSRRPRAPLPSSRSAPARPSAVSRTPTRTRPAPLR
ncbi:MAG: twin-arginine translocation signal domain-containing protein [Paracoccaceae bacterium]